MVVGATEAEGVRAARDQSGDEAVKITLIKKIKADGSPCKKCEQVLSRLEKEGHLSRIDEIVVADERDPESDGMKLAAKHGVELAPFFIVDAGGEPRIYTTYHRFV